MGWVVAHGLRGRVEMPNGDLHLRQGLVTWDGTFYDVIATSWYRPGWEGARFFPVYPGLGRLLAPLLGGRTDLALVVLNNVAAFAAALVTWRLVHEVLRPTGRRPDTADRAATLVAVFPAGFVLALAYSEGLAVLLVAATLLALHRRAWLAAGVLALAAAALRPVGGLLVVPIAVEVWHAHRAARPERAGGIAPIGAGDAARFAWVLVAPVLGLVGALWWIRSATGDLLLPVRAQQEIRGGFQDPVTRVLEPIGEMATGNFDDAYNFAFMVLLLALLVVSVRRSQPRSWIAFSAVSLVVVLSAQVTDSLGRYGLVVVPLVVALAQWSDRRWRQVAVAIACSAGLVALSAEAWLGRVVP
jgi:hypothetical protein